MKLLSLKKLCFSPKPFRTHGKTRLKSLNSPPKRHTDQWSAHDNALASDHVLPG